MCLLILKIKPCLQPVPTGCYSCKHNVSYDSASFINVGFLFWFCFVLFGLWYRSKASDWPTALISPTPVTVLVSSPKEFGWPCWPRWSCCSFSSMACTWSCIWTPWTDLTTPKVRRSRYLRWSEALNIPQPLGGSRRVSSHVLGVASLLLFFPVVFSFWYPVRNIISFISHLQVPKWMHLQTSWFWVCLKMISVLPSPAPDMSCDPPWMNVNTNVALMLLDICQTVLTV